MTDYLQFIKRKKELKAAKEGEAQADINPQDFEDPATREEWLD